MPHRIGRVIECDRGLFERQLNLRPFEVAHTLREHPLLQLPALVELAEVMARKPGADIDYNQGVIETREERPDRTAYSRDYSARLLRFIHEADASITLRHVEREDGYRQIMEALVLDALSLAGPAGNSLLRKTESFEAVLLITSPNRVTEYHVDGYCSWIFQVQGAKSIHLFDRSATEVLPEAELERFYAGEIRIPRYRPQFESQSTITTVSPGTGLHIPVNTPHWLQNGAEVSISLNIVFHFHDAAHASLYRANHLLRNLGLRPALPGRHPQMDRAKRLTMHTVRRIGQQLTSTVVRLPREAVEERRRIRALVAAQ